MTWFSHSALVASVFALTGLSVFAQVPNITTTRTDGTPAATKKNPGETVTYTSVISNAPGAGAATGVQFTDPDVAGAAVVASSVKVSPLAFDDTYPQTVVANTSINTNTDSEFSVTANDYVGMAAGTTATITITAFDSISANGGAVTMVASGPDMGKFTYAPAPGYVGSDSFTYTITNNGLLANTGTVSLTVSGPVVWFVNATTGNDTSGKGTLALPYATVTKAATVDAANHRIYVAAGTYPTTAVTLESNELLVGQGAVGASFDTLLYGSTIPGTDTPARPFIGGSKPLLSRGSGGSTITLGENNVIQGFSITNTGGGYAVSGTGINAAQIGNLTTSDVDLGSSTISGSGTSPSGAVFLSGGNGNITVNAPITTTAGRSVTITARTASSVTFPQAISDTSTGISLTNNSGATIAFSGGLTLNTGTNPAFIATGGGTVTATQDNSNSIIVNTLATTTATALNVTGTNIGAAGLQFRSISTPTSSGNAGIILRNTGSSGGLTVTGSGSPGSGGTIANKTGSNITTNSGITEYADGTTGTGIILINTANVSLARMQLNDFSNYAIYGNGVTNFSLTDSVISGVNGNDGAANEGSILFGTLGSSTTNGLTGTATFSNLTVSGGIEDNVVIRNRTGTLSQLTVSNCTVRDNANISPGNEGFLVQADGNAVITADFTACSFQRNRANGIHVITNDSGTMNVAVGQSGVPNSGGTFTDNNIGVHFAHNSSGTFTAAVYGATFSATTPTFASPINVNLGALASNPMQVTLEGNGISNANSPTGPGIRVTSNGSAGPSNILNLFANNNTISQIGNRGIEIIARDGNSTINATVTNNSVQLTDPLAADAIRVDAGAVATDTVTVNLDAAGNDANTVASLNGIRIRQRFTGTTYRLEGYSGSATDNAAVANYLAGRNPLSAVFLADFTGTGFQIIGNVPTPTAPLFFATSDESPSETTTLIEPARSMAETTPAESLTRITTTTVQPTTAALTQNQLDSLVISARARWEATGLSNEQKIRLHNLRFEIIDFNTLHLGQASGDLIQISSRPAGNEWFIDETPADDTEFSSESTVTRRAAVEGGAALGRVDLLTTVLHEMGHSLGLCDTYSSSDRDSVMYGFLGKGERRLPENGQAASARPHSHNKPHFLTAPIDIGVIPPGKSVTIIYDVVINDPVTTIPLTSQGTVSGTNFNAKLTDDLPSVGDPALPGAEDPTVTLIERPDTTVATLDRTTASPTNTSSVTWQIVFANPVSRLTAGNFSLVNTGLGGAPAITTVTAIGGAPATTWTITSSTGTGSGSLALNMANDAGLTHDVTNQPFPGQVYTIDLTPPDFTSIARLTPTAQSTNADSLVFRATFSESVVNVNDADFTVTGTSATISGISGSGSQYDITLSGGDLATLDGTVGLSLAGGQNIADTAGNALTGSAPATSETYTLDNLAPTVAITSTTANPAPNAVIPVTVTFSESVTAFDLTDITVDAGTATNFAGTGANYTFDLTPSGVGVTVTADIAANAAQDDATNGNTAATQFSRNIRPSLTASTVTIASTATQLVLDGAGFSTTPASNTVALSSGTATVTAATATQLTCSLSGPLTLGVLNATVTVAGSGSTETVQVATVADAPTISSPAATNLSGTTVTLGADVTSDGGQPITERGVVYSPTSANNNPQIGGAGVIKVTAAGTTGAFTANITGLITGTAYSFAGYATNSVGTTYTTPASTFTTLLRPTISVGFGTSVVGQGGTTTITWTMQNPNADTALTGVGFSEGLPESFLVATTPGIVNGLGGTVTAVTGSNIVQLNGGTLAAGASASVTVNITPGTLGVKRALPSFVTSTEVPVRTITGGPPEPPAATVGLSSGTLARQIISGAVDAGDPTQTGRINRFAVVSVPGSNKSFPGEFTTTGARNFESHTISNPTATSQDVLVWVNTAGTGGFVVVYLNSFDPANIATNYLADPGSSFTATSNFGFTLPAGQSAVIVVHSTNVGQFFDYSLGINNPLPLNLPDLSTLPTIEVIEKSVSIADLAAINEGNSGTTNFTFTITRTGDTTGDVNLTYTVGGAAVNAADFGGTLPTGTATITAGNATTTASILVSGDTAVEPDEVFTVTLSAPDNGYVISGAPATGTINNDDAATVSITTITNGVEADAPTAGKFRVALTAASSTDTTVSYNVTGTASSGTDFSSLSGSVTVPAGQITADIDVTVLNEGTTLEPTETVILTLGTVTAGDTNITLGSPSTATMDITDDDTAAVTIAKITDGAEPATNTLFRVTQTAAATVDTVLTYTVGGTATIAFLSNDFTAPSGSVTILAGQTTADISVGILDDNVVEPTETLSLTLTGFTARDPDVSLGSTLVATANILDDDTATAYIESAANGNENIGSNALFFVRTTQRSSTNTTIAYTVSGTAANGTDFTTLSGSVTIGANSLSALINVSIIDDAIVEGTETVTLTLTAVTAANTGITLGSPLNASANITDNDAATISIAKITDGVEAAAPTNALFRVTQTAAASTDTVITYTVGGTATSGSDFTAPGGSLTILAGQTTADISVAVIDENVVEPTETVSLTLTGFTARDPEVTLGTTVLATANITDSDTSVITLAATSANQNEGTGGTTTGFAFSATLSNPVQGGFTIAYTTSDGSALAGSDYTDNDNTLTFTGTAAESKIITVFVSHDDTNEIDETFTVALSSITGTTLGGSLNTAGSAQTGTILNDDAIAISIASTDPDADENTAATGTWRVSRNGLLGTTTVQLAIDPSSSAVAADWTQTGATFASLAPGSTGTAVIPDGVNFVDITLIPVDDLQAEATETVRLNVTSDAAYVLGSPADATVTIGQNDFLVTNTNDAGEGTLRQAVLNANAIAGNDTITFDAAVFATPRTITLTSGQIAVTANTSVQGTGTALLTLNGNATSRIFNINNGASVDLSDLTVTNGATTSWGGAINVVGGSNVSLLRTVVSNSTSQLQGGGIYVSNATLSVQNCTISGNTATTIGGGGIATGISIASATVNVTNSTISGNSGPGAGAMLFGSNAVASLNHTTITNNTTSGSGAAVDAAGGAVMVANCLIAGNVDNTTKPDVTGPFTSNGGNLIGNNGAAAGFTGTNDLNGTGASPVNPLLAPLTDNGGPTLTHALLNGSPAINNGLVTNLPKDTFDQRGDPNLRTRGPAPDTGAYEAFAFEPTLTTATTNEDTQSTSGLVITANTADGGFTTHYKITAILNGTLFKNNGTTAIANGSYITKAEGLAGLKFTPTANLNTGNTPAGFGFTAQAAVGTSAGDERGTSVPVTVTVNAINDAPTVVLPGLSDQILTIGQSLNVPLSAAFADIESDELDFTVQTNSDGSIASAIVFKDSVNLAGLASGTTSITILADDGQGGTVTDTFLISVGTVDPTPLQIGTTATLNRQNGLFEIPVIVTNTTPYPINGFRLRVDYNAYKPAHPSLILFNASSPAGASDVYLDYPFPLAVDGAVSLTLSFYTNNRRFPVPFVPGLSVESLGTTQISGPPGEGVQPTLVRLPDRSVRLEFVTEQGKWYRVRYSPDLVNWFTSELPVQATGTLTPWIDNGPPYTTPSPVNEDRRFYLINEIPAP